MTNTNTNQEVAKMNKMQREAYAYQLRKEGLVYREIGEYFGVCLARARDMVKAHEKREEYYNADEDPLVKDLLADNCRSTMIINNLRSKKLGADTVAAMGAKAFKEGTHNLGPVSIKAVAESLVRIKKIDDKDLWLNR